MYIRAFKYVLSYLFDLSCMYVCIYIKYIRGIIKFFIFKRLLQQPMHSSIDTNLHWCMRAHSNCLKNIYILEEKNISN